MPFSNQPSVEQIDLEHNERLAHNLLEQFNNDEDYKQLTRTDTVVIKPKKRKNNKVWFSSKNKAQG